MKTTLAVLVLAISACAGSQAGPREGAPASGTLRFDPATVETVDGQVLGVDRTPPSDQVAGGVHLTLRDRAGLPVTIELAPGWYLDKQGLHFDRETHVQVRGSRVKQNGSSAIVVEEITTGGRVVRLRDAQGRPLWSGGSGAE